MPGGWTDEDLIATAAKYPGVGSDADLPDLDRFRAGVSRLVGKYRRLYEDDADSLEHDGLSVFVLPPGDIPVSIVEKSTRVPMLDRGREPIENRVWFVTHLVNAGRWIPADFDSDDELFRFITEDLKLGSTPAVIYDSRRPGPELRVYLNGLADVEAFESLHIAFTQTISLEDVYARIDAFHKNQVVTPGVQHRGTGVWQTASKGWVKANAEDVLGGLLCAGLQMAYPMCKVRAEQPQPAGRLDIEIVEGVFEEPGTVHCHAILELKVLREFNVSGNRVLHNTILEQVRDGVAQAAAYRNEKDARNAALCCFDMRLEFSGTQCFADVVSPAAEVGVELRVWHLFSSAAAYRRHQMDAGALTRRPRRQARAAREV